MNDAEPTQPRPRDFELRLPNGVVDVPLAPPAR
jgi:hypothetical protein